MTSARDIRLFGVTMLVVTIAVLWVNLTLLAAGQGSLTVTAAIGLLVGVGGFVVGEVVE